MAEESSAAGSSALGVVVLIVGYNSRGDLDECLGSVFASVDPGVQRHVLVVDNASSDGSIAHLRERWPAVERLELQENRGFAGGNNAGWELAQRLWPQARYLALLNADTRVESGWLAALTGYLDAHPQVGAAQAKLLLHPSVCRPEAGWAEARQSPPSPTPDAPHASSATTCSAMMGFAEPQPTLPPDTPRVINTLGNRSHFLGFGYMLGYGLADDGSYESPGPIDFASGAAVAVRTDLLGRFGLFDDAFFLYLEDADLSWKLRLAGYETHLAPGAVVYHKYVAKAPFKFYHHLERNRWLLLLTYYRWRTLLLLLPAILFMELGQGAFALRHGLLSAKLRSYAWFFTKENIRHWRRRRAQASAWRTLSDREFLGGFSGRIVFSAIDNPLLRYLGNPLLAAYWTVARWLIRW